MGVVAIIPIVAHHKHCSFWYKLQKPKKDNLRIHVSTHNCWSVKLSERLNLEQLQIRRNVNQKGRDWGYITVGLMS